MSLRGETLLRLEMVEALLKESMGFLVVFRPHLVLSELEVEEFSLAFL